MSHLPVVTLWIFAFRFLIMSTPLGFTGSLICLWSTLLFFQIITAWLRFAVFGLLLSMRLIGYALTSHNCSFSNVPKEVLVWLQKANHLVHRSGRHRAARHLLRSEEHTSELQSPCNLVCR